MSIGPKLKTIPPPLIRVAAVFFGVIAEMIWPLFTISPTRFGILLSNLWVLICLVPTGIFIDRFVIPEEEHRLDKVGCFKV